MYKRRVLLTGSTGWLAQFVYQKLALVDAYEVYCCYHNSVPEFCPESKRISFDLSDPTSVSNGIKQVRPHAVLHLAALSSPATCEKNPGLAELINSPCHLIDAVNEHAEDDCLFIFTSTDLVFDGNFPPYLPHLNESNSDNDSFLPATTQYGITKRNFEKQVLTRLKNGVVLRLSNMIGPRFVWKYAGTKFMQFLMEAFQKREVIGLRFDEVRSFVSVHDVVEVISRCLLSEYAEKIRGKAFNVGGPEGLSRLDMAKILARSSGVELCIDDAANSSQTAPSSVSTSAVTPSSSSSWTVFTTSNAQGILESGIKTPKNVTLNIATTEETFGISFQSMTETIQKCITEMQT